MSPVSSLVHRAEETRRGKTFILNPVGFMSFHKFVICVPAEKKSFYPLRCIVEVFLRMILTVVCRNPFISLFCLQLYLPGPADLLLRHQSESG